MGKMGLGYGSEFHLLRYLGYHRHDLNRAVEVQTGGQVLDWLDFAFDGRRRFPYLDIEWKGLNFLDDSKTSERSTWLKFWPQTGNVPNWDAIGILELESKTEYLLVEAKAHVSEIRSHCSASEQGGLPKIRETFSETIRAYDYISDPNKWLSPFYQYANRLAQLHFLLGHKVLARLIFIYFVGDQWLSKRDDGGDAIVCPQNEQDWQPDLRTMYGHLGLSGSSKLEQRVHSVFLHV